MGTPRGPQGVGRDRNTTETPKSHPCRNIPISPGKNWTFLVGRAPVTPALTQSPPAPCCRQRPQQRFHSALVERSPAPLPLPPRAKNQLPGEGAELPPGMQRARGQKEPVGAGAAPCPALAAISGPETGPAPADGSLQMDRRCQQVCSAWPFPWLDPSPSLGWGNARESGCSGDAVGDPQARVTLSITKPPSTPNTP